MISNILMTSLTPPSNYNEINSWENRPFTIVWPDTRQIPNVGDIKRTIKKKTKRVRTTFTTEQLRTLEDTYTKNRYIDLRSRRELSTRLNIGEKAIKIWFQNRRMKEKKDASESSCDSSTESNTDSSLPTNEYPSVSPQSTNTFKTPIPQYQLLNHSDNLSSNQYIPNLVSATSSYNCDYNGYPTHYYPNYYNVPTLKSPDFNTYTNEYFPSGYHLCYL